MTASFIRSDDFAAFVTAMIEAGPVYGPVAKRSRFVFERLETPDELRLDYDVTILPPKKLFFPPAQDLHPVSTATGSARRWSRPRRSSSASTSTTSRRSTRPTSSSRSATTTSTTWRIARPRRSSPPTSRTVSTRAFFATVGADVQPKGHDAFLTTIGGGYVFETLTERGEALLKHGAFQPATDAQIEEAAEVNAAALARCPEKLEHGTEAIAAKVRAAFGNEELWAALAADCFSCGTCNTVCPTCYCFDVQDTWNVDQTSGQRTRYWDGCLTEDFAKFSLGEGACENFREERGAALPPPRHAQGDVPEREAGRAGVRRLRPLLGGLHRRHRRPGARHRPDHGLVRSDR